MPKESNNQIINRLLIEFQDHRDAIMKMIKDIEQLQDKMDKLIPNKLDARYVRFFEEKIKVITEFFKISSPIIAIISYLPISLSTVELYITCFFFILLCSLIIDKLLYPSTTCLPSPIIATLNILLLFIKSELSTIVSVHPVSTIAYPFTLLTVIFVIIK